MGGTILLLVIFLYPATVFAGSAEVVINSHFVEMQIIENGKKTSSINMIPEGRAFTGVLFLRRISPKNGLLLTISPSPLSRYIS